MRRERWLLLLTAGVLVTSGCAGEPGRQAAPGQDAVSLGPKDGRDLPGSDLDRIAVGDVAPDFSLVSLAGPVVTLSDFRGKKDVVLVFYRGYW